MAPITQESTEIAQHGGETSLRMDTISVTASRNEIDPFVYPGMVTVMDRNEIENLQPSTPDDVLKLVPNVEFSGGPRRTGFAYQPSGGLLDGFRLDLGIDNAFDEEYARVFTGANEAGRNFKAAVSYSLNW